MLTDAEQRELLESYRPWLRKVAHGMCRAFPSWAEDLAAEGWVDVWRGLGAYDSSRGPRDAWLKHCACQRMVNVVKGWHAQCRDARITDLVDEIPDTAAPLFAPDAVEMAYHDGDLLAALNTLTARERRYVELRFWHGMSHEMMRTDFSKYEAASMWRWIKPKLAAALGSPWT